MIDEKKLIEDVWKHSNNITSEWETAGILNLINKQPKVGEWIPCNSGKLPKLTEGTEGFKQSPCCLVAVKWWDGDITESVGWYNQSSEWSVDSSFCKAIAWMPLPEPYKGE